MNLPAFYPIIDNVAAADAVLAAGARILQFRHKGFFARSVFEDASRIADLCRKANALFVVNDRADIAMLLGSALHLGQEDLAPSDARRIMPAGAIIGFSTHNEQQTAGGRPGASRLSGHRSHLCHRIEAESRSGGWVGPAAGLASTHAKTIGCDRRHHSRISAQSFRSGRGLRRRDR